MDTVTNWKVLNIRVKNLKRIYRINMENDLKIDTALLVHNW